VEATPESVVHPPGIGTRAEPYYTTTHLPAQARRDLLWWVSFLELGVGRSVQSNESSTLVPSFGDGSGTGTGGTYDVTDGPLKM
jgi:hypothetical protein